LTERQKERSKYEKPCDKKQDKKIKPDVQGLDAHSGFGPYNRRYLGGVCSFGQ